MVVDKHQPGTLRYALHGTRTTGNRRCSRGRREVWHRSTGAARAVAPGQQHATQGPDSDAGAGEPANGGAFFKLSHPRTTGHKPKPKPALTLFRIYPRT